MYHYAIADLHGRHDLFARAIAAITQRGGGKVFFLGDYIDRGPDSRAIVERLIEGPPPGQTWIPLAGNHEAYLVAALEDQSLLDGWLKVGGRETLMSYGWDGEGEASLRWIPIRHRIFLARLARNAQDAHRVFVHAGVDPTLSLEDQSEKRLLWDVYADNIDIGHGIRHVVHGHEERPDGPALLTHRTNLDVHAWKTGRLCVGVFDPSLPGGPQETFDIMA